MPPRSTSPQELVKALEPALLGTRRASTGRLLTQAWRAGDPGVGAGLKSIPCLRTKWKKPNTRLAGGSASSANGCHARARSLRAAAAAGALDPRKEGRYGASAKSVRPRPCPLASLTPRALRSRPAPNDARRRAPPAPPRSDPAGGVGRGALCLCWEGAGGPCGRDSPCCWDPWLRCARGSGCEVETSQDTIPARTLRTRGPRSSRSAVYRTPAIGWLWGVCGLTRGGAWGTSGVGLRAQPCSSRESPLLTVAWVRGKRSRSLCALSNCAHFSEPHRPSSTR